MALSNDQRAMLRLLAQREQGYEDIAALMGLSVDEVRAKVADALAQLQEEGVAPPQPPAAADPEPEPVVPLPPAPEPPAVEPTPVKKQPDPLYDDFPPARAAAQKPQPTASAHSKVSRPKLTLPSAGGARAAIAAGLAALVLVIVILVVGGGDDSGDTTTPAATGSSSGSEETIDTASTNPKLTQAVLSPLDDSDAKGLATFGRVKNSLALQIEAEGLAPTGQGESYTIWLYESAQKMLPLASTVVPESGKIGAQVQVPTEVLAYLAKETFDQIDISLTNDATLKASLAKATREKKAPLYTGTDVLRGTITGPIIGAADKK